MAVTLRKKGKSEAKKNNTNDCRFQNCFISVAKVLKKLRTSYCHSHKVFSRNC